MRFSIRRDDGFTLVETMIVVAILGFLVAIAILTYTVATGSARNVTCHHNQRVLQDAVHIFASDNDADPVDIDDLESYVTDFDRVVLCPNDDGTSLEYDVVSHLVKCPNHP